MPPPRWSTAAVKRLLPRGEQPIARRVDAQTGTVYVTTATGKLYEYTFAALDEAEEQLGWPGAGSDNPFEFGAEHTRKFLQQRREQMDAEAWRILNEQQQGQPPSPQTDDERWEIAQARFCEWQRNTDEKTVERVTGFDTYSDTQTDIYCACRGDCGLLDKHHGRNSENIDWNDCTTPAQVLLIPAYWKRHFPNDDWTDPAPMCDDCGEAHFRKIGPAILDGDPDA